MKKILCITASLLFFFTFTNAQKTIKSDFLIYKFLKGYDTREESGSRITVENEYIHLMYGYSQYFDSEEYLKENFVFENENFKTWKNKNLEFKIYKGHIPGNRNVKNDEAELYLCQQDDFYIAVIRPVDDDIEINEMFQTFINSLKTDPKVLAWKPVDIDIFTISLPDFISYVEIDFYLDNVEIGMEEEDFELNPFYIDIHSDYYDPLYDTLTQDRLTFSVMSNGMYYGVRIENDYGYQFSRNFFERIKAGIKTTDNQPPGEVIKVSGTWGIDSDISDQEWDWLFIQNGKSVIPWNTRKNMKGYFKYTGISGVPTTICQLQNEHVFIGNNEGDIKIFDIYGDKIDVKPTGHSKRINKIKYVYQFGIVSCSDDNTLKVWSTEFDEYPNPKYVLKGHTDAVTCFDDNRETFVSGSKDNTLRIWDTYGKSQSILNFHSDDITAIKIYDKINVISASKDGEIILWNLQTKKKKKAISLKTGYITCFDDKNDNAAYFRDFLAAGTSEGEIIVWNKETLEEMIRFKDDHSIKLLRFYMNGIMSVNSQNKIKYWDNLKFKSF